MRLAAALLVVSLATPCGAEGLMARFGRGLLIRQLSDADPTTRRNAAEELGRRGDQESLEALATRVRVEGNLEARRAMLTSLGVLRDPGAIPVLLEMLSRTGDPARPEAVRALGRVGDARAIAPLAALLSDERLARAAASALARIGSAALPRLVALLADGQAGPGAAFGLGELGDERAVPALISVLSAASPDRRTAAAAALGLVGDPRARKALASVAQSDPDPSTRAAALDALELLEPRAREAGLGPGRPISELASRADRHAVRQLESLATAAGPSRREALRALALIAHPRRAMGAGLPSRVLVDTCSAAMRRTGGIDARDCVFALGAAEDAGRSAVEALTAALGNPSEIGLRREAALALGRLGEQDPLRSRYPFEADPSVRAAIISALGDRPEPASVPVVMAALARESGAVAIDAVATAGALGDRRLEPLVAARLSDPDALVRANAALAVGRLGNPRAVASLRSRLDADPEALVRANAARAIGMLAPRAALASLEIAAEADPDPVVRDAAQDAMEAAAAGRTTSFPVGEDVFRSRFTDTAGRGTPDLAWTAILPDGRVRVGWSDSMGEAVIFDVPRGTTRLLLWQP
ncbi:MAG: HEAT repeat domain-containing protein [Deltaproteobacteria bacterium]|nr:HEAT repeat domain-containing protein [Deltaproteobacteria bacterium]